MLKRMNKACLENILLYILYYFILHFIKVKTGKDTKVDFVSVAGIKGQTSAYTRNLCNGLYIFYVIYS